ncbi:MAG TPA: ABC transporter permease [Thermomicrobiaceae bacterium]|nr:ABC transporter permease [Thermomicrobiaceae bacterium]
MMIVGTATLNRPTAGLVTSTLVVARRAVLRYLHTPKLIVFATLQMTMFMVFFRYIFGGAISSGGIPYVDFLVPGFITAGVLFTGIGTAVAVAEDLEQGFVDRLRSLPIPRGAVLAGRAAADTTILVWSLIVSVAIGFGVGFRLHGTVLNGLIAFGLCVAFGYAFEWLFIALGQLAGNAQAAQGVAFLVFPLTFVSSAYVPTASMPRLLRVIAEHQPLTVMIDAVRALTLGPAAPALLGHAPAYFVTRALLWALGILLVSGSVAIATYRRG